jgi:choline dehydrogenase-like flavoprotein
VTRDITYDIIVVGAGSAGAVIAARLSKDPGRRILLLEAGPDYPRIEDMPADILDSRWVSLADHDWAFRADAGGGRTIEYPRGKVVGGSSSVNATLAIRGDPADYDGWAALGNDKWSWGKCLPYFRKLESDQDFGHLDVHGSDGPIPVVRFKDEEFVPLQSAFVESALKFGHPHMPNHNSPEATGVGAWGMNRIGNTRISTAYAYLAPARDRANLTVRGRAHVTRILFEATTAVGVEYEYNGEAIHVFGGEVILSAGAILSPAVLWRSGIGPGEELRALGTPVVLDAPGVGANLVDHPVPVVAFIPKDGVCNREHTLVQTLLRYSSAGSSDRNDMMIVIASWIDLTQIPAMQETFGVPLIFALVPVLELPKSRGRVRLTSADSYASPEIDLNYYSDADGDDIRRAVEAVRICSEIAQTKAIGEHAERFTLDDSTLSDDDALAAFVRMVTATGYHPVGTCKMGPSSDSLAVVDQFLRVHGVDHLRVADASVMPVIPRANTNLTTIMIGERVADFIEGGY